MPSSEQGDGSKVHKVLACAECRRLKIKCDRVFPCRHCSKRGLASICPERVLSNGARRVKLVSDAQELQNRIDVLEDALRVATSNHHELLRSHQTSPQMDARQNRTPNQQWTGTTPVVEESQTNFGHLRIDPDHGKSRYFGAASSFYLSRHVTPNGSNLPSSASLDLSGLFVPTSPRDTQQELDSIITLHLPPPELAETLADIYFQTFGWYTIIVRRKDYDHDLYPHTIAWTPERNPQKVGLVFLILALGALMDFSRSDMTEFGRQLFAAAKRCLALDATPSVTLIRCMFLYGTAIMNGGDETVGGDVYWPFLRMTMCMCEELGLHRDGRHWGFNEEEVMDRAIVFWEIHGFDVLQSIALGRGQCIADYAIDCPIPPGDAETGFSCQTFHLTRIWSKINDRQIRIKPSPYSEVVELDKALQDFERDVPQHLSPASQPPLQDLTDTDGQRIIFQSNMLSLFINEAKLALHRGSFARALKEYPLEPQASPQKLSYLNCLEAARAIILTVRNMLAIHGQMIHRRWHFFFHLFSACVCLAAAAIRAPSSNLAKIVLSELEMGVALFRMTKRSELTTIEKLRDCAVKAVEIGITMPPAGAHDDEDLDLLGARTSVLQRTEVEVLQQPMFQSHKEMDGTINTDLFQMTGDPSFRSMPTTPTEFNIDEFIAMWCLPE